MNTPAHLILGCAAFGRPDRARVTLAALAGGLIPDLSLYLLAGWNLFVMGTPPGTVFGTLYFSEAWQSVFRVDNSFVLWGMGLALALWAGRDWAIALTGAALLHLACDFALHHDDARAQFWPITTWVFHSPLSYWDRRHFGGFVGPAEVALCFLLVAVLWRRYRGLWMRSLVLALLLAEALPGIVFGLLL